MTARASLLLVALWLVLGAARVQGQEEGGTARRHAPAKGAAAAGTEDRNLLHQLSDAQRALGEQVQQLRDRVEAIQGQLSGDRDQQQAAEQEVKGLREEVKGLYVELSGVKEKIDAVKNDVAGVNSNVSAFRTFSGFFIALMILLMAVIFVLTIRR